MEGQIKEEEVVWVKLRGYPWWPAVVKYKYKYNIYRQNQYYQRNLIIQKLKLE